MKFFLTKKTLMESIEKMHSIATKGIKADFQMVGKVTVQSKDKSVLLTTSNGHLDARLTISKEQDTELKVEADGTATVDVSVFNNIVKALGGKDANDHLLVVELDNSALRMKDTTAKSKKFVKMQVSSGNHEVQIRKPSKPVMDHEFESEIFCRGIDTVGKYCSPLGYKLKYQMICLHFLPEESRFVCGDGMRFAILRYKEKSTNDHVQDNDSGDKYLFPVDQANIIKSVCGDATSIKLSYKNPETCYVKPNNNLELSLKGIPREQYIAYENHAFRIDEAVDIVDINRDDLVEGTDLVESVKDIELLNEGAFHSCHFIANANKITELAVNEGKYQCEWESDSDFYKIGDKDVFKSEYASKFLHELAHASNNTHVRFYCIDERSTIVVQPCDITDKTDDRGVPMIAEDDNKTSLSFFFASVGEED